MVKDLSLDIRYLKGIGPKKAKSLNKLGIYTIDDLFYYFPRRYEDRTSFYQIKDLKPAEARTIKAKVLTKSERHSYRHRGFSITEIVVGDETGKIPCVWFNQPYLNNYFEIGEDLILYGRIEEYGNRLQMNSPEFEIVRDDNQESLDKGRIVPIYSLPEGFSQRVFRKLVKACLDEYVPAIKDFLPFDVRQRNKLFNLAKSILNIHFPESLAIQKDAYRRLSFEEFIIFQLPLALRKLRKKEQRGIAHKVNGGLSDAFINNLPFKLTTAQQKVIQEIKADMARAFPMQRLLQGDVGSGKTVVAILACFMAIQGGYQAVFMVPTEILAKQHYNKVGNKKGLVRAALLTSALGKTEKEKIYKEIKDGKIDLVIGTHALLQEAVEFKNLGLAVIDEQHKFGVGQRALLSKKGINPDVLIMTATPIPRTLAITLYADLEVSVIDALPPGRTKIKTLHFYEYDKLQAYKIAKEHLKAGSQAFIIYPVIEESYALDMAGAKKMYEELKSKEFKDFRLGLIHGRLSEKEQDEIMVKFRNGELDALVSTTVLEVGIDIPNATCIIIENAHRFGLAQLHQLRGRIGRGIKESTCVLISNANTFEAKSRLGAMVKYSDGFHIAEEDLRIRGPGEFFGARQHGLTELKIANPLTQMHLLKDAREEAVKIVNLDPHLEESQNSLLKEKLIQRFPEYEKLMLVG